MRRLSLTAATLALTAVFYLALIDTTSLPELYAGLAIVVLAVAGFEVSRAQGFAKQTLHLSWFAGSWRAVLRIPADIGLLAGAALRSLLRPRSSARASGGAGAFRAVRFRGGEGPEDRGRAAAAELVGSLAPNTIVLGVHETADLLLVHQLAPRGKRRELDPLELG